ncbi:MAG: aldose 1-epimerase [Clostridia bacterium]|nr:aldose 1-epimerase [Clostridia bacterium]
MTYTIRFNDWQADVCPRLGANVTALKKAGRDVLRPLTDEKQLDIDPYLQGAPLLFPANRTRDGRFTWQGKNYQIPINEEISGGNLHGFLHFQVFPVDSITENAITMSHAHTADGYFPFSFLFTVTYRLDVNGFTAAYTVKNTDKTAFPFTFATHTTFVEPDRFRAPVESRQERDERLLPTGRYVPLNTQEQLYASGAVSKGNPIVGYYKASGHTAYVGDFTYTVSENFDHFILYNGKGVSGFLCVEPQSGAVDGLNIADGHNVIDSGETMVFTQNIQ